MELYVIAGGEANSLKRWQEDLSAQFFPVYKDGKPLVTGKNAEGKDLGQYRRLLVAPVQLYKIAFAKEELNNVLPLVCPSKYIQERYTWVDRGIRVIRKLLGLKEAPYPTWQHSLLQPNQVDKAVFVIPIGLKDDATDPNGLEMI